MTERTQYSLIYDFIRQQIQQGVYPKGAFLPSENELSAYFQTTRMTVRQALHELVNDGFIERLRGKGSIVKSERQALGLLSFKGFTEIVGQANHAVSTILLESMSRQSWSDDLFENIVQEKKNDKWLVLKRLRLADEHPVMLEYTYLPAAEFEPLIEEKLLDESLFKTLSVRFGINMRNLEQHLRAIPADAVRAELLKCPLNSPLIYIERKYITNHRDTFIFSKLYCFTDHFAISDFLK